MAARTKILWIFPYATFVLIWTYGCSRGSDGNLVAAIAGFSLFAILYWADIYRRRPIPLRVSFLHLAVFDISAITALALNPQLDELGGVLNFLIPTLASIAPLGGMLFSQIPRAN